MRTSVFIIVALCLLGISYAQSFPSTSTTWTNTNINSTDAILNITNTAHFDYPIGLAIFDVQILRGSGILNLVIENNAATYHVNESLTVSFSSPVCRNNIHNLTEARVYYYSVFFNSSVPVEYKITLTRMSTVFALNNSMTVESQSTLNGLYAFTAPEGEGEKNITVTVVSSTADISNIISGVTIQPRLYCVPYPDSKAVFIAAANNTKQWTFSTLLDYNNFTITFNPLPNGNFGDFTMLSLEANVVIVPYDFSYWKALIIAGAFLALVLITGIVALALVRRRRSTYAPLN
jgi:hypothetical protein